MYYTEKETDENSEKKISDVELKLHKTETRRS